MKNNAKSIKLISACLGVGGLFVIASGCREQQSPEPLSGLRSPPPFDLAMARPPAPNDSPELDPDFHQSPPPDAPTRTPELAPRINDSQFSSSTGDSQVAPASRTPTPDLQPRTPPPDAQPRTQNLTPRTGDWQVAPKPTPPPPDLWPSPPPVDLEPQIEDEEKNKAGLTLTQQ